ncbi:MAG: glycosyltransferase involved in cell wall biosynthesis, partial [Rhodothermales bacterium]
MLKEKLEILLITYNRAAYLDSTLRQFSESPFRDCRFTILDNCSEDETPAICEKYRSLLTGLTVIRHPKNIGANGNQLRSLEISKADYTWLICDDDVYDFSSVSDLVNVMEEGSSDLIVVGTWDDLNIEQGVFTTTQALLLEQKRYFSIALFGPSVIYRT